jgi:predicted nucleic acid-binding Zn finger protein
MSAQSLAHSGTEYTLLEARALRLFEERGHLIRTLGGDRYEVPSGSYVGRSYFVHYGGSEESCSCSDFQYHGEDRPCKHLLMVGIKHAAGRSGVREVRSTHLAAGDPFKAAKRAARALSVLAPDPQYFEDEIDWRAALRDWERSR